MVGTEDTALRHSQPHAAQGSVSKHARCRRRRQLGGCRLGLLLPLLGVWWLWRVAALIEHPGWRLLWRAGTIGGTLLLLLLVVILGLLGLGVVAGL